MSFKDYFEKAAALQTLVNKSAEEIGSEVESVGYHTQDIIREDRFIPHIDFSVPGSFAKYGSAAHYYDQAIKHIYEDFPYDGSLKERLEWENESTYLDLHIYDNEYPRTNGYIIFSADGGETTGGISSDGYGTPTTNEYIYFKGGPHPSSHPTLGYSAQFTGSNQYEATLNRENNLKFDLKNKGVSIEFWLNKSTFITGSTQKEVIFDLWNNVTPAPVAPDYGRLQLVLTSAAGSPFRLTCLSGTTGVLYSSIASSAITTASVADGKWHHYAVTLTSASSGIASNFYIDGTLDNTTILGSSCPNEVTGALQAQIGALITQPQPGSPAVRGSGKLSGSLDEFRYWKTERSGKDIGRYWFTQVAGGTNTDPLPNVQTLEAVNTNLGVYYKFNEGITGRAATDSVVLDYSGRVTNGAWTGYTSNSRNTGSAMVLSTAATREFKDPIIYSFHPEVAHLSERLQVTGSNYDDSNNAAMYNMMPNWIIEEDEEGQDHLRQLTQIMCSYFDTLQVQVESLANLKDVSYLSSSEKPLPFADRLLRSSGLVAPDLFIDADVLEKLADRSEDIVYEKSLNDVKNTIYQNIYNNLVYIYKSKGTEKAFRNLMRCFGVDEELIKLNVYANNIEYEIRDNRRTVTAVEKFIDFNTVPNQYGTVFMSSVSGSAIDASGALPADTTLTDGYAQTLETEILFPRKPSENSSFYFDTNVISASLFGVHGADGSNEFAWPIEDRVNYQVHAVRDEVTSTNVRFVLSASGDSPVPFLISDLYEDVYDNTHWNLAVRIKPEKYPLAGLVAGAGGNTYTVELHGIQMDAGDIRHEFTISGSAEMDPGDKDASGFVTGSKRVYLGAHRQDFTSTVLQTSDVKISACRYWLDYLDDEVLRGHAFDTHNYGSLQPHFYAFPFSSDLPSDIDVLKTDTLLFNWEFSQNTGSSVDGQFTVADEYSGSASESARYGIFEGILGMQYPAIGYGFPDSSTKVVDKDFLVSSKLQLPENVQSNDMINVFGMEEQTLITPDSRPINYFYAFEKSMAAAVSVEMINYFATLKDINTLIGEPVNRYRTEYKGLKALRQRFFERVSNSEIDFEKFYEFYKWFDSSLTALLQQLIPASADFAENIRTIIESHMLERSKYQHKFQNVKKQLNLIQDALEGSGVTAEAALRADDITGTGFGSLNRPSRRQVGSSQPINFKNWDLIHAPVPPEAILPGTPKSILFDGVDEYLASGDAGTWEPLIGGAAGDALAFSVSMWVKPTTAFVNQDILWEVGSATSNGRQIKQYDTAGKVAAQYAGSFNAITDDPVLSLDTWTHLVVTFGGGDTTPPKIYADGSLAAAAYTTAGSPGDIQTNGIGISAGGDGARPAEGYMCDVAVWDTELSSDEVTEVYGSGNRVYLSGVSCAANLLSWWRMGSDPLDTYDGIIYDQVGGRNATPYNLESPDITTDSPSFVDPYDIPNAPQNSKTIWWRSRAERGAPTIASSSPTVNKNKQTELESNKETNQRAKDAAVRFGAGGNFTLGGVGFNQNKKVDFVFRATTPFGSVRHRAAENVVVGLGSEVEQLIDTTDVYHPSYKQRLGFGVNTDINRDKTTSLKGDGNLFLPFSIYSSSVDTGYNKEVVENYASGTTITSLHHDLVYNSDIPMQGPFTEKFVGGRQYRHAEINKSGDSAETRGEGFKIQFTDVGKADPSGPGIFDTPMLGVVPPNYVHDTLLEYDADLPTAHRLRNVGTKRPVNIQNIKMTTASLDERLPGTLAQGTIGNYQKNYQIVQSNARMKNDPFFNDQSFDFALHPETLATRGRFPLAAGANKSLLFDGDNDYVSQGDATEWDALIGGAGNAARPMSFSMWINPQDPDETYPRLISVGTGGSTLVRQFTLSTATTIAAARLDFQTTDVWANGPTGWTDTGVLIPGAWQHVVVTYEGGSDHGGSHNVVIYIDGAVAPGSSTDTTGTAEAITTGNLNIGQCEGGTCSYKGYMCDTAVWNKALSADEVAKIYGGGRRVNLWSDKLGLYNSLISWWKLGADPRDSYDGSMYDQQPAGRHGAPNNFPAGSIQTVSPSIASIGGFPQNPGGNLEYALPNRTGTNSNQSIIVNRFAGCGYEVMSRGYMDPAHEELSVYNALPYRNLAVINYGLSGSASVDPTATTTITVVDQIGKNRGLNQRYSLHCGPFGSDAAYGSVSPLTYVTEPSYHKTNRNARTRIEDTRGNAGEFNNSSTKLDIGLPATWDALVGGASAAAKPFTFGAWVYPRSLGEALDGRIFEFGSASDRRLSIESGYKAYFRITGGDGNVYSSAGSLPLHTWTHVLVTYSGGSDYGDGVGTMKVYINGVEDTDVPDTTTSAAEITGDNCYIGNRFPAGDPNETWDGYIDDVAIWDRALGPAEIGALYNGGYVVDITNKALLTDAGDALTTNLIAWYRFDEGLGDTTSTVVNRAPSPPASTDGTGTDLVLQTLVTPPTAREGIVYDNWYVQHQIPRSEQQYSWLTASLEEGERIFGLQAPSTYLTPTLNNLITASSPYTIRAGTGPGVALYSRYPLLWGRYSPRLAEMAFSSSTNFVGLIDKTADPVNLQTRTLGVEEISPATGNPFGPTQLDWYSGRFSAGPKPNAAVLLNGTGLEMMNPTGINVGASIGGTANWDDIMGGAGAAALPYIITAWIKPEFPGFGYDRGSPTNNHMTIFHAGSDNTSLGYRSLTVTCPEGKLTMRGGHPGGYLTTPAGACPPGVWSHVLAVYGGGNLGYQMLVINGVMAATAVNMSGSLQALSGGPAKIGYASPTSTLAAGGPGPPQSPFNGSMRDVAIWHNPDWTPGVPVLTVAANVAIFLYNGGIPEDVAQANVAIPASGLQAWWRFNPFGGDTTTLIRNQYLTASLRGYADSPSYFEGKATNFSFIQGTGSNPSYDHPSNPYAGDVSQDHNYNLVNALLLNRNGPYGYPTWKQIRTGETKVARAMRRANRIGQVIPPGAVGTGINKSQGLKSNFAVDYVEQPIASNAKPVFFAFEDNNADPDEGNNVALNVSYQNTLDYFSNTSLNNRLGLSERVIIDEGNALNTMVDFTLSASLSTVIKHGQRVYPADTNVYQNRTRTREQYEISDIWNSRRLNRSLLGNDPATSLFSGSPGRLNSQGAPTYTRGNSYTYSLPTISQYGSVWPLDAAITFMNPTGSVDRGTMINITGAIFPGSGSGAGELQNTYSRYSSSFGTLNDYNSGLPPRNAYSVTASALYAVPLLGGGALGVGQLDGQETDVLCGFHPWTAPLQAGLNPYKPYLEYADNIRRLGKDMSIVPEFRISEHIAEYLDNHGSNFLTRLDNMFTLTGSTIPDSSYDEFFQVYSTADFMKYFRVVDDDMANKTNGAGIPIRRHSIELSCDGLLQFLPYKGFYPVERTMELASLLSQSLGYISVKSGPTGSDGQATAAARRALIEPLMSPGILFNTIKSGIACSSIVAAGRGGANNYWKVGEAQKERSGFASPQLAGEEDYASSYMWENNFDGSAYGIYSANSANFPAMRLWGSASCQHKNIATWGHPVPFEALRNPEEHLSGRAMTAVPGHHVYLYDNGLATGSLGTWNGKVSTITLTEEIVNPDYGTVSIRYQGQPKSKKYRLAIDNFLCEAVNFFQEPLKSYISKPEDDFLAVEKDKYYGINVNLYTSDPMTLFGIPEITGSDNFGMYNRASSYGHPAILQGTSSTGDVTTLFTPEPHLPPHWFGNAEATLIFKAPYNGKVGLDDIIAHSVVEYDKVSADKMLPYGLHVHENDYVDGTHVLRPQISQSVNLFEKLLVVPDDTNTQQARWLVQTKFETPVLNFYGVPAEPMRTGSTGLANSPGNYGNVFSQVSANHGGPFTPSVGEGDWPYSTPKVRGMWHQLGKKLERSQGIYLSLQDAPTAYKSTNYGYIEVESLNKIVGFEPDEKRIGEFAEDKIIEEAIVCIPFLTDRTQRKFFDVDYGSQEYVEQLALLNKYVFPPTFDFLINPSVEPIAFYAFEFSATLSQDDLMNIWQNLPPSLNSSFQQKTATVKIRSLVDRLLGSDKNLQWMVFKVKRRAEKDYNIFTRKDLVEGTPIVQPAIPSPYSYNWPYDYFSLVELIKIEQDVVYATEDVITAEPEGEPIMPDLREFIPSQGNVAFSRLPQLSILQSATQGTPPSATGHDAASAVAVAATTVPTTGRAASTTTQATTTTTRNSSTTRNSRRRRSRSNRNKKR